MNRNIDVTEIAKIFLEFSKDNLVITDDLFPAFLHFKNFSCSRLTVLVTEEETINKEENHRISCPNAELIHFDVRHCETYFPDFQDCSHLDTLIYHGYTKKIGYNFRHNPLLKRISIDAPLEFLYKYTFKMNPLLQEVYLKNVLEPSTLWFPLHQLTHLTKLSLENCNITEIPDNLDYFNFPSLHDLNLKSNHLKTIPTVIQNFKNLKLLDLSHNEIEKIPSWFNSMDLINILYLNSNNLTEFPKKLLMNLKSLEQLNIANNPFPKKDFVVIEEEHLKKKNIYTSQRIVSEKQAKYMELAKQKKNVPTDYLCPISREIMIDPVITSKGFCYDRYFIHEWYKKNHIEPCSGEFLEQKTLTSNFLMRDMILNFLETKE